MIEKLIRSEMEPYVTKLNIKKEINYIIHDGPVACQSNPSENHEIYVNCDYINRSEAVKKFNKNFPIRANLVHELCHLYLAENFDYSLAGIKCTGNEMNKLIFATLDNNIVDMWVNDEFNKLDPELFRLHQESWGSRIVDFIKNRHWDMLMPPLIPYGLGKADADSKRFDSKKNNFNRLLNSAGFINITLSNKRAKSLQNVIPENIMFHFGHYTINRAFDELRKHEEGEPSPKSFSDIGLVSMFLENVPKIPYEWNELNKLHEHLLNEFSRVMRIPLIVKLEEKNRCANFILE